MKINQRKKIFPVSAKIYLMKAATNMPCPEQGSDFYCWEMKCQSVITRAHFSLVLSSLQVHPGTNNSNLHQASPLSIPPVPPSDLMQTACLAPLMQLHNVCTCRHVFLYEKNQNLTPPTHTLHSLTLNGHCYGNNSLTWSLERHLAQIMKEEMRHWVRPCMVWWLTVAPSTDYFGTPWGPCPLWSVTFWGLETAFSSTAFVFIPFCAGLAAMIGHRTEFAVSLAWSSIPLLE